MIDSGAMKSVKVVVVVSEVAVSLKTQSYQWLPFVMVPFQCVPFHNDALSGMVGYALLVVI